MRRGLLPPRRGDASEDAGRGPERQEGGCVCVPKSLEEPKHQDLSKATAGRARAALLTQLIVTNEQPPGGPQHWPHWFLEKHYRHG